MGVLLSPFSLSPSFETGRCCYPSSIANAILPSKSPNPRLFSTSHLKTLKRVCNRRTAAQCNSSNSNGARGPGSGDNESKVVLDAFFLGKAFAEELNERVGSTVGEILSMVGQWQAEQKKQVQDFQGEVVERAKKAKAKAVDNQGIVPKPSVTPPDSAITVAPSSRGPSPTTEDPFQQMLKE